MGCGVEAQWVESCSLPSICMSFQFNESSHGHVDEEENVSIIIGSSFMFTFVLLLPLPLVSAPDVNGLVRSRRPNSGAEGVVADGFEGAVDVSAMRYMFGRPLGKLEL